MKRELFSMLFILIVGLIAIGCSQYNDTGKYNRVEGDIYTTDLYHGGLHYVVVYHWNGGVAISNYTKDSLICFGYEEE